MARRKKTRTPRRARFKRGVALGSLLLAAGGILLLRSPTAALEPNPRPAFNHPSPLTQLTQLTQSSPGAPAVPSSPAVPSVASGVGLRATVELSRTAGVGTSEQSVFAEITLDADEQAQSPSPVALAIVLDTSGSMMGHKIEQAREALRRLVQQMSDTDLISILRFGSDTQVLWNTSPVGELRGRLDSVVRQLQAAGGTQIPHALSRAAVSLEGVPDLFVRRVILVSDGQDGSGITMPELRRQIQTATHRGIAFSAMGLGSDYDESFLTTVADSGAGSYAFIRTAADLEPFLSAELRQTQETVVDQTFAELRLPPGWRVQRAFGIVPERGATVTRLALGQLTSGQSRRAIVELRGPGAELGQALPFDVSFSYRTTGDRERHVFNAPTLEFMGVSTNAEADASRSMDVYVRCEAAAVDDEQRQAILAWRNGDSRRAERLTTGNQVRLQELQRTASTNNAPGLARQQAAFREDIRNFRSQSAQSAEGRAYGLQSNSSRRARAQ